MSMFPIFSYTFPSNVGGQLDIPSIPQTFKHLQLRISARNANAANTNQLFMQLNGDTTNSYDGHFMSANGSSTSVGRQTFYNCIFTLPVMPANNELTNAFGAAVIDFHDYTSTSKFKVVTSYGGFDNNNNISGNATVGFYSGLWTKTEAINRILINPAGNFFSGGSKFDLYGFSDTPVTGL